MTERPLLIVVLAAGQGTRMNSTLPKALHTIAGRPMLGHVLALAAGVGCDSPAVVIGSEMDDVKAATLQQAPQARVFVQKPQHGTAHAVLAAREAIDGYAGDVLVLYADTPLIKPETLARLRKALDEGASLAVLGFDATDPTGYGRLVMGAGGLLEAIVEEGETTLEQRDVRRCNSGVMAFRVTDLLGLLDRIGNANAKGEYYLTDAVRIARGQGHRVGVVMGEEDEVLGINARDQLAAAETIFQRRARAQAMRGGATLIAPETVWFSHDTVIGRDVIIEPNVFFGPGVVIEDGAEIKAHCHLEGARIGQGARVGPFARCRPGAVLAPNVHIGNFVEVKNSALGEGAKANHLSYLGDGEVGAGVNIGAGTIFCNYDGFFKHRTVIGDGAFIGSNASLVAPVRIAAGAYVGSGSVITRNVEPDALAIARAPQEERVGWAAKFRAMMTRRKAKAV